MNIRLFPPILRLVILAPVFLINLPAHAGTPQGHALTGDEKKFLDYVAQDNQGEIQIALLAEKKARHPAVKAFARLMIDDHVQVESQMAALTNKLGVQVPVGIGHEAEDTLAKLEPLTGSDFDQKFMAAQIEDHSKDIEHYQNENDADINKSVKEFISQTIPTLRQHLELAKSVDNNLSTERTPSSGTGEK